MAGTQADVLYWTGGAGNGQWGDGNNWATHSGSPTTTTPSTGEGVLFDDRAATGVTADLAQSATSLSEFKVTPGFRYDIGSESSALEIDIDDDNAASVTPMFRYAGSGAFCKIDGAITNLEVEETNGGVLYISGGTTASARISGGETRFESGTVLTALVQTGVSLVMIEYNATAVTSAVIHGGTLANYRDIATADFNGGSITCREDSAYTTMNINGAAVTYLSGGTVTTLNGNRGSFRAQGNSREYTITNSTVYLASFVFRPDGAGVRATLTNPTNQIGFEGGGPGPVDGLIT